MGATPQSWRISDFIIAKVADFPNAGDLKRKKKLAKPFVTISMSSSSPSLFSLSLYCFLVVRSVTAPSEATTGFDDMVSETKRKYYMLGGKGGVGKTSCAASLAVKFANNGHPTLVVSTDPAHSLSDSFAQDLTGGTLVPVEGPDSPLFALEINPEKAREEFRSTSQKTGGNGIKDFMDGMGLGMIVEQLEELKLGELLDTPPPGLDEAIAISKVIQFLESREYNMFTRIVFDTAPTGHTLRLLSLPDFLDASIGKILKVESFTEFVDHAAYWAASCAGSNSLPINWRHVLGVDSGSSCDAHLGLAIIYMACDHVLGVDIG
ncbi:hypothetical protein TEA_017478 [Camellia sinensis var. sinensis]|uniref:ArsA/GET3 Anion-transporting ATPase-like domain-containing protein n=1 Tax=Camellia sinensis var. sinensis TaxID=542762 RepID=A0A4S4EQ19_CAMSN|nr:hypothetical protein TEA_017478 [Camellia sinensis var. sinensis]